MQTFFRGKACHTRRQRRLFIDEIHFISNRNGVDWFSITVMPQGLKGIRRVSIDTIPECEGCEMACQPHPMISWYENKNEYIKLCTLDLIKSGLFGSPECSSFSKNKKKNPNKDQIEILEKQIESIKWNAHTAAGRVWKRRAQAEVNKRGIKGKFLLYAQGSRKEPKWSKDLFAELEAEELKKRSGQIRTMERKIRRLKNTL